MTRPAPSVVESLKIACSLILCVTALSGCSTVFMRLPSVQHCEHVTYQRDYNHVQLTADCKVGE